MEEQSRNDPCNCGSGKKFKNCCAHKPPESQKLLLGVGAVLLVGLVWGLASAVRTASDPSGPPPPPPGKVWSEEHQHFHDVPLGQDTSGSASAGKVWSEEHQHYHDAPPTAPSTGDPPPPGDFPADPPESSPN